MFSLRSEYTEVLGPVIRRITVDVVNDLTVQQRPPYLLFGYEYVFEDVPICRGPRMVGRQHSHVTTRVCLPATDPAMMVASAEVMSA